MSYLKLKRNLITVGLIENKVKNIKINQNL